MLGLLGKASLFENKGATAGALENYQKLAELCAQPAEIPKELQRAMLEKLVAYGIRSKNYEIAEKAQQHIVDLPPQTSGRRYAHMKHQEAADALSRLADIYQLENKTENAKQTLKQIILLYNDLDTTNTDLA